MQTAANGTLFLDEVTSLPTNTQAKLLRVLQERQYYPVGDVKLQEFNASIVSASNMSFEKAIEFHHFRKDLRYRLVVIPLKVPALRDRRDDIILLGGMMQQSNIVHTEGMPKLKNIPLLGRLFGQEKQRNSDYEVWIMIRPSILGKN